MKNHESGVNQRLSKLDILIELFFEFSDAEYLDVPRDFYDWSEEDQEKTIRNLIKEELGKPEHKEFINEFIRKIGKERTEKRLRGETRIQMPGGM